MKNGRPRLRRKLQEYKGKAITMDELHDTGALATLTYNCSRDSIVSKWNVPDIADRFFARFGTRLKRTITERELRNMVQQYLTKLPPYLGPTGSPHDTMIGDVRYDLRYRFPRKVVSEILRRLSGEPRV